MPFAVSDTPRAVPASSDAGDGNRVPVRYGSRVQSTPDPSGTPPVAELPVIDAAGRTLRAPWAASVAGLLFSAMFTASLVLIRTSPLQSADDAELVRILGSGDDIGVVIGALYLAPLAGIMFLWFIAVVRDQVGDREDRFFSTVFLGSGVLFVALLFVTAAVASSFVVAHRFDTGVRPTASDVALMRGLGYALLFAFATRAAGVFLISTATIGLRTGTFPRWFALTGYLLGGALLIVVAYWDWAILVLPAWVAVVSLFILRRERARQRSSG